jgi:hypothetical protein
LAGAVSTPMTDQHVDDLITAADTVFTTIT